MSIHVGWSCWSLPVDFLYPACHALFFVAGTFLVPRGLGVQGWQVYDCRSLLTLSLYPCFSSEGIESVIYQKIESDT